jgi:hypothetical protein
MNRALIAQIDGIEAISKRVDTLSILVKSYSATKVFIQDAMAFWLNCRSIRLNIEQYCEKLTTLLDNASIIDPEDKLSDDLLQLQQQIKTTVADIESIKVTIKPYADSLWFSIFLFNRTIKNLKSSHSLLGKIRIALMEHDSDYDNEGPAYSNAEDLIADLRK